MEGQNHEEPWYGGITLTHLIAMAGIAATLFIAFVGGIWAVKTHFDKKREKAEKAKREAAQHQANLQAELDREQREQRRRREIEAIPTLHVVASNPDEQQGNKRWVITVKNRSRVNATSIESVVFRVTEQQSLNLIAQRIPKPREYTAEAANSEDTVYFERGYWDGDMYVFQRTPTIHIKSKRRAPQHHVRHRQ